MIIDVFAKGENLLVVVSTEFISLTIRKLEKVKSTRTVSAISHAAADNYQR